LTEEQQDGSAPAPEAIASSEVPASAQTVAAVAVADEPVATEPTPEATPDAASAAEEAPAAEAASAEAAPAEATEAEAAPAQAVEEAPVVAAESAPAVAEEAPVAGDAVATAVEEAPAEAAGSAPVEEAAAAGDVAEAAPAAQQTAPESVGDDAADAPPAADIEDEEPVPAPKPRPTGPEPTTMEELLAEQDSDIKSFKHGDVVEGTVVRIDKDEMLVDIGAKSEGVVSNRELYGRNAESQPELSIGDTVLVYVLQPESPEGHVVLSLRRAGLERKWRSMQELFEAGTIIDAPVIDHNKGGLIVDCGIRGFVPISQIVDFPRRPQNEQPRDAAQEIAEKLQPYIGRKLRLKILEVNRKANRLILSEKVALYEERREKRDELFSSLQVGQKVTGSVRSIAPFGIFIDLGGIDGLVHKSELSWNKVNNPEAGYKVGDEVEAEVIDINHERGRISLSIRRLQPDPWESTVADFNVGDVIDGTVTKLVNFGAFVRVREGLEGLIHISELSHQRVAHPGDVVHEGQVLKLKIISLDSERHRLGLSLKQAEEAPVRSMPEPGVAPAAPAGERRERRERRERPERSYSPSDALAEPEGGIDTTLAAAFAQVRAQLADAESTDEPATAQAPATDETAAAEAEVVAVEPATDDVPRSQTAEVAAEGALTVGAAEAPESAEAAEDPEAVAAEETAAAPAAEEAAEAPAVEDAPEASAAAVVDAEAVAETPAAEEGAGVAEAVEAQVVDAEAVDAEAVEAEAVTESPTAEDVVGTAEDETATDAPEADAEKA
jgi:small subunit ribosomal protein S1